MFSLTPLFSLTVSEWHHFNPNNHDYEKLTWDFRAALMHILHKFREDEENTGIC